MRTLLTLLHFALYSSLLGLSIRSLSEGGFQLSPAGWVAATLIFVTGHLAVSGLVYVYIRVLLLLVATACFSCSLFVDGPHLGAVLGLAFCSLVFVVSSRKSAG